ncbi:T9SS type A sorting domain-containing protein [bacterium SCSIO 12741]|nr:T9SS type A sorting domain-containing protein [bacterium SCSIO 12741]
MKSSLFFLAGALFTLNAQAQLTLDSADVIPASGTSITYYEADNPEGVSEGSSGVDVIWDFSDLTPADSFDMDFENPQTGILGDPDHTTLTAVRGFQRIPYRSTPQALYLMGDLDGLTRVEYGSDSLLHISFPMAYNDLHTTSYDVEYGLLGNRRVGTYNVQVDAIGTLHMPYGYLNDVLRLEIEDMYVDSALIGGNTSVNNRYYEFWQKGAPHYVLRIEQENDGGQTSTTVIYQGKDQIVEGRNPTSVQFADSRKGELQLYPNPAKDQFQLKWNASTLESLELMIINGLGQIVKQQSLEENGQVTVDIQELPAGMYQVKLMGSETHFTQRLIKR